MPKNNSKTVFSRGSNENVWDDTELIKMYNEATAKTYKKAMDEFKEKEAPSSTTPSANKEDKKWKVGDNCMAPYELDGKWYPAAIESISEGNGTCDVNFTGYDTKATVKLSDLMSEDEVEWISEEAGGTEQEEPQEQHLEREEDKTADVESPSTTNNGGRNLVGGGMQFSVPNHFVPPPPSIFDNVVTPNSDREAYNNALMGWYMAGYHTGYCQGMMHQNQKMKKPKDN